MNDGSPRATRADQAPRSAVGAKWAARGCAFGDLAMAAPLLVLLCGGPALAQTPPSVSSGSSLHQGPSAASDRRGVVEQSLRHIYAVYLGLRSCSEISVTQNDRSFLSEVSLDEARRSLRLIDSATREVGIDPMRVWNDEAPVALVTAEALKVSPETHLSFCQRMGSLFRMDTGTLQSTLILLGAKSPIITKDY